MSAFESPDIALFGPDGRALVDTIRQVRPPLLHNLKEQGKLESVVRQAERHFNLRKTHHGREFDQVHPEPQPHDAALRRIARREDYVKSEIQREMRNWVNNYPNLTA